MSDDKYLLVSKKNYDRKDTIYHSDDLGLEFICEEGILEGISDEWGIVYNDCMRSVRKVRIYSTDDIED